MTLDKLLQRQDIWRMGRVHPSTADRLSTGFLSLDAVLPGGGWPKGALTEIFPIREGIGELRLVIPALIRLSRSNRWIAWITPPRIPYAPALATVGIDLSRVLLVRPTTKVDTLWATEQALRYGKCGAVLAWPRQVNHRTLRRLQLAAEAGQAWGFLFRSPREKKSSSPAALRLRLEPLDTGLVIQILKCRGGHVAKPIILKV